MLTNRCPVNEQLFIYEEVICIFFLIIAIMLVRTLILLRNCDFEQCNGNIDYYTVTLPMSKKTFYPVRKVRIIKEYYTPCFKRDNSPDSYIPALPKLTQSVTTDTLSQRSFFWLRYKCTCISFKSCYDV